MKSVVLVAMTTEWGASASSPLSSERPDESKGNYTSGARDKTLTDLTGVADVAALNPDDVIIEGIVVLD